MWCAKNWPSVCSICVKWSRIKNGRGWDKRLLWSEGLSEIETTCLQCCHPIDEDTEGQPSARGTFSWLCTQLSSWLDDETHSWASAKQAISTFYAIQTLEMCPLLLTDKYKELFVLNPKKWIFYHELFSIHLNKVAQYNYPTFFF